MIDLKKLRESATHAGQDGYGIDAFAVLEILDQLEAAQKDAARYQWIRETYSEDGVEFWPDAVAFADTEEKLDAAIDAAMASKS